MPRKSLLLKIVVSFAIFMEMLDVSILNTAIPSIAHSLQVSPINLKIALISYLVMLAIFIPISGWVADRWGAKKIFIAAMSLFTLSSFACGLSHTLVELIITRCFQGIGGAFMVPVARLLLVRSVPRSEIAKVGGQVIMMASLGVMLGPVLGGLITEYLSWPWIFFINIPVGMIAIIFICYGIEKTETMEVSKFDTLGFLLFGFGLAFFIFGLSASSEKGFPVMYALFSMVIAIMLLVFYFLQARGKKHAVINTQLFKFRSFQVATSGGLCVRLGFGGIPFLLPLLFQIGFHYSPAESGLLLMPMALGIFVSKTFVPSLLRYLGYRRYLIINTVLVSFLIASFTLLRADTPWALIVVQTFILGILFSLQFSGMNSLAYQEVNHQQLSGATSVMGTMQQFSDSLGVAFAALLLHLSLLLVHSAVIIPEIFKEVFIILGCVTLLAGTIFLRLKQGEFMPKVKA